jgi:hypothetical protein
MKRTSLLIAAGVAIMLTALAVYLRDPPWAGSITSGMRAWEEDPPGTRFRWTAGRASFFIPSNATTMTLPMRAVFPGKNGQPVVVSVSVDDRCWRTSNCRSERVGETIFAAAAPWFVAALSEGRSESESNRSRGCLSLG